MTMVDAFIITGANGDIALSMAEILREARPDARLIGTDVAEIWPAMDVFDEVRIIPKASDEGYLDSLRAFQNEFDCALIIPTSEPELRFLSHHQDEAADISLLMNDGELILNCMDKLKSIQWLEGLGLTVPKTKMLSDADETDLPIMAKPRFGAGSRGLEIIRDVDHLEFSKLRRADDPVAQELLDVEGQEYTCAILKHGDAYKSMIMHREMKGDVTGRMKAVHNDDIENVLKIIADNVSDQSAINVQLRLTDKGPMIFEVNPRFSSTVKMRNLIGFPDFLWAIELFEGRELTKTTPLYERMVYRAYREIVAND